MRKVRLRLLRGPLPGEILDRKFVIDKTPKTKDLKGLLQALRNLFRRA